MTTTFSIFQKKNDHLFRPGATKHPPFDPGLGAPAHLNDVLILADQIGLNF